jgi:hypothetical protein
LGAASAVPESNFVTWTAGVALRTSAETEVGVGAAIAGAEIPPSMTIENAAMTAAKNFFIDTPGV